MLLLLAAVCVALVVVELKEERSQTQTVWAACGRPPLADFCSLHDSSLAAVVFVVAEAMAVAV